MKSVELTVRVVLLEPEKAGNIGSVARAMKNFDLRELWLVNPKALIDGESRAYAMHGVDVLDAARRVDSLDEATKDVSLVVGTSAITATSTTNLARIAMSPREFARRAKSSKGKIALVLGRESSGLNNREVERCDFIVSISASRKYNTLNVSSAATILFYELYQQRAQSKVELASHIATSHLLTHFRSLSKRYERREFKRQLVDKAFRNVISRSFVTKREASLLMGVLRKASSEVR